MGGASPSERLPRSPAANANASAWARWLRSSATTALRSRDARNLVIVHANIVAYAMAYWLTNPLMPFLLKEHGASSLSLGAMQSLFNLVQLAGGLVVGYLQDHYSGSAALSVTQLGSALVYVALFSASSLTMLYLSRLPTVLQQSMQVAQAYVSKAALEDAARTVSMSRLSISYAVGMIVGSSASGRIAEAFGMRTNAALAVGISVACMVMNKLFLRPVDITTKHDDAAAKKDDDAAPTSAASSEESYMSLAFGLRRALMFLACLFAARTIFEPVNNLTLVEHYKMSKTDMGSLTSTMATVAMIANVVLLPALLKVFTQKALTRVLVFVVAAAYVIMGTMPRTDDVRPYLALLGIQAVASTILYTTCTTYAVSTVASSKHGRVVAMSHALRSAVGIVCPLAATYVLQEFGSEVVALTNAGILAVAAVIIGGGLAQVRDLALATSATDADWFLDAARQHVPVALNPQLRPLRDAAFSAPDVADILLDIKAADPAGEASPHVLHDAYRRGVAASMLRRFTAAGIPTYELGGEVDFAAGARFVNSLLSGGGD